MELLKALKQAQEQLRTYERENYALKQTKGDAMQLVKMEDNVKKLESQLKDQFKGQLDMMGVVKENMEMAERIRELEKKVALHVERLREYEEITRRQGEEADHNASVAKTLKAENDGLRATNSFLEE